MSQSRLNVRSFISVTFFAAIIVSLSWLLLACGDSTATTAPTTTTAATITKATSTTTSAVTTTSATTTSSTTTSATAATTTATTSSTTSVATTAGAATTAVKTTVAINQSDTTTGNATVGKDLLRRGCGHCHLEIGTKTGPSGQPNLATSPNNGDLVYLRTIIRTGKTGGVFGVMPAHTPEDLTDSELEDIVAYINSIKVDAAPANSATAAVRTTAPAPTPTPVLPTGNATTGATYFRQMGCQGCHPSMGKLPGTRGQPNLSTSTEATNPAYTRYRIRFGFVDESSSIGNMPGFKNDLTDQELEDLVAYVLSINTAKK